MESDILKKITVNAIKTGHKHSFIAYQSSQTENIVDVAD